jgi:hypothetical protein
MGGANSDLIYALRSMARGGGRPSAMLREIVSGVAPQEADRQLLVRYFSEAFCLTEGQAYHIFGWFPDGTGQLKDSDIDYLLAERIRQTRAEWDDT